MTVRSTRWSRLVLGLLVISLLAVLTSCADTPQSSLEPAGEQARKIDSLFNVSFWIAAGFFIFVQVMLVFVLFYFRQRPGRQEAKQVHGNTRLELAWTIVPALILAGLAIPTVSTIFDLADEPADALQITVTGHQWWWEVEYPELGVVTANEVHIPTGRPVRITLESADVIHSFWVPQLAGKQDLVPGNTEKLTIQADKAETYMGQCAEFCGLSHANMRFRVIAQDEGDFEQWVADQKAPAARPTGGLAAEGAEIFQNGACIGCHAVNGTPAQARVGPDLTHFASRTTFAGSMFDNTPENVAEWLHDPPGVKPGSKMPNLQLSPDQIEALVAYLEFLK
jgi:cytochrome c oxidase subunit 2